MKNHNVPKILKPFFLLVIIISMVTTTIPIHVTAATDCAHCGGTGDCSTCSGLGDCRSCFGSKEDICTRCFNGRCLNCGGEGVIKSYSSGKIKERKCSYCNNGKCRTCSGSGRISCSTCSGTGDCRTCSGDTECRYYDGYGVNYNTSSSNTSSSNTGSSNTSNNTTNSKPNSQYLYIDCTELTLTVGESYTFTVRGRTNDGKAYAVFDETFFKEAEDGSFTYAALKAGNSTIEFRSTDDTVSVSCKVTITENKQKTQSNSQYLEIDCTELTLTVGKSYTFTVSGHTNDGIAYAIFDETFFTEAKDGSFTYTALKAGTSIIEFRSTDDTVSVSCKVTVKEKKQNTQANSQYLELDCTELTLTVGETYTFNVTGKTNDGIIQTVYDTTFFKKEANRNFTYTALKAGTTTIEFRSEDNSVSVSCEVTIKEKKQNTQANSQYLELDCTELTLTVGETYTFNVTGKTNGNTIQTVYDTTFFKKETNRNFTYTALKAGTSIIEFRSTDDTVSVSCKVTVKEKKQNTQANSQYLELDCTELTLTVGETYTFNVTGKTNDGIIQTVYDTTFFKKEANRNFTYTALKAGTTTIEFRSEDNTVSVSCKVTIKEAKNTLMVTVDGTEEIFYLKSAEVVGKKIHVRYECYNPRGEEKYDLRLQFNNNMEVGTYKIPDSAITPTVIVYFDKANVTDSYCSYQKYNVRYPAKTKYTTIFTIEDMNEDWTTYTGTLETTLANRSNTVTLTLGKFNFTLGEQHDMTK